MDSLVEMIYDLLTLSVLWFNYCKRCAELGPCHSLMDLRWSGAGPILHALCQQIEGFLCMYVCVYTYIYFFFTWGESVLVPSGLAANLSADLSGAGPHSFPAHGFPAPWDAPDPIFHWSGFKTDREEPAHPQDSLHKRPCASAAILYCQQKKSVSLWCLESVAVRWGGGVKLGQVTSEIWKHLPSRILRGLKETSLVMDCQLLVCHWGGTGSSGSFCSKPRLSGAGASSSCLRQSATVLRAVNMGMYTMNAASGRQVTATFLPCLNVEYVLKKNIKKKKNPTTIKTENVIW